MGQEWFLKGEVLELPSLTDFLNLQAAYAGLPTKLHTVELRYEEKFKILQSPSEFLPRLRRCRIEDGLRGTFTSVAYIDIDDFKAFNTKYTESVIDRELLSKLMQAIEAHAYAHGWAYRYGGDEFTFILPNMMGDSALTYLHKLQEKIHSTHYHDIAERITLSVGYLYGLGRLSSDRRTNIRSGE
jgi:diguanylate cyclase (GGDEF)-like protein